MMAILARWAEWWPLVAMLGGVLSCGWVAVQLRSGVMGSIALALLLSSASYLLAHHRTWAAVTAHYAKVVNSALSANAKDEAAIAILRAANDRFAKDATAQAAQIAKAKADMAHQARVSASQLAAAQARLQEAERENQTNRTWAAGRVPAAVADSLRR